jgi:hypothetical protein
MIPALRITLNFGAVVYRKSCFSTAIFLLNLLILLTIPIQAESASNLWITDVTPRSFSLVWTTTGPATGSANIYSDPQGNTLIGDLTIIDAGSGHPPAGDNGVIKVTIMGLIPDTTYYFETVTTNSQGTQVEPAIGDLPSVRTENKSIIVKNISIAHRIVQSDGITPANGALLLVEIEGGNYPITGWVGEGLPPPFVLVNLDNVYSATTHQNLELIGGEALTLTSIGGSMGTRNLIGAVPVETEPIQTLQNPEPCPRVSQNPDVYDDVLCTLEISLPSDIACEGDLDGDDDTDGYDIALLAKDPLQLAVSTFASGFGLVGCSEMK